MYAFAIFVKNTATALCLPESLCSFVSPYGAFFDGQIILFFRAPKRALRWIIVKRERYHAVSPTGVAK
jgi:hypothetical protein